MEECIDDYFAVSKIVFNVGIYPSPIEIKQGVQNLIPNVD